jgi:hypothetical protein
VSIEAKKLYVMRSLKREGDGFKFILKNTQEEDEIIGFEDMRVDNFECITSAFSLVQADGTSVVASEVTPESPLDFGVGVELTVLAPCVRLIPMSHLIIVPVTLRKAGYLRIIINDNIRLV